MLKFDNGLLTALSVDIPRIQMNVMQDQQDSYRKYITKTVYEDMTYLESLLRDIQGLEEITLSVKVGELVSQTFARTQVNKGRFFYPVIGTFSINGQPIGSDLELLRIPYMDDYCKINVQGASKVVLCTQRPSEDISYTLKDNMFNIAMPHANVRIFATSKAIKVNYGKYKINMDSLISAMMYECGDTRTIHDIFANTYLLNTFVVDPNTLSAYCSKSINKDYDILRKYKSVQYELGNTRTALNEMMTIGRAVGCKLSRPVLDYPVDTTITENMIPILKRNRINELYVLSTKIPDGYIYGGTSPVILTKLHRGLRNCPFLRKRLPRYSHIDVFDTDIELSCDEHIVIATGEPITSDMPDFLTQIGYSEIQVTAGTSKKLMRHSFEREVVGNYTAKLSELSDKIPDGRFADEWVYYYNNPELDRVADTHLNAHDMIAILSIMGQIIVTGESPLLNRDTSFLKKVMLINDTFSESLCKTMSEYVRKYAGILPAKIKSTTADNVFYSLTKAWIKTLNTLRVLAPADTVNLAAEISQACHIDTVVKANGVADDMRHLAIPYYGRICPFETPAGKKLGLVNTKAIGAKVVDGLLMAPCRKVIKTSDGIRISNHVTYLSVKDELGHKFGDLLSLKTDKNGKYINTPVVARVPNPTVCDEPFIFANIMSFDLAGGYVEAYPEQFLSPTVALVPFAGSDDATRISFGANQARQAIYLPDSEIPYVTTFMYGDMFNYSGALSFVAPCSGIVTSINNQKAIIKEDVTGNEVTVPIQNGNITGQLDMTVDILVKPGTHVNLGDQLAEGYKYPQSFVVRAPFSGTIRAIRDNAIEIEKSKSMSEFVNLDDCDLIAFDNGRIMGQSAVFMNIEVCVGDFVEKGQIIATTSTSRNGIYSPCRNELVGMIFTGYNYEDGIAINELASVHYTSLIANYEDKTINKKQFPHASANPLQGYKYCGPGDVIGRITTQEDVTSPRCYTEEVKASIYSTGIPYEFETLEDDLEHRKYRFHMLGLKKSQKGDKYTGRHGNKGTASIVLPNSKMPMLANGLTINMALNPCGLPSRMNIGQVLELHCGLVAKVLNIYIRSDSYNGATTEEVDMLVHYAHLLTNTPAIGPVGGPYSKQAFDEVCAKFPDIPQSLHDHCWKNIDNIMDWYGVFDYKGDAKLYDPLTGTYFEDMITIGYSYIEKLEQEVDSKLNYRSGPLDEQYSRTTSQPQKGDISNNGQRNAEMELMSYVAYGAASMIDEIINERSDNIGARQNAHLKQLGMPYRVPDAGCTSRAVENLIYDLEAMGVKLEVPKEVAAIDQEDIPYKKSYNLNKLIQRHFSVADNQTYKLKSNVASDFTDCADFFKSFGIGD